MKHCFCHSCHSCPFLRVGRHGASKNICVWSMVVLKKKCGKHTQIILPMQWALAKQVIVNPKLSTGILKANSLGETSLHVIAVSTDYVT